MLRTARLLVLVGSLSSCGVSIPPPLPNTGGPAATAPAVAEPVPAPSETTSGGASAPSGGGPTLRDPSSQQFEQEIQAFETADRANPPKPGGILFVGSSSIRQWTTLERDFPRHRVQNRGFGGSRIRNVTDFADRIVIPYSPRLVVFFAGSNDIHDGSTADRVLSDFKAFVTRVRSSLPAVRIAFVSITTSPSRFAEVATVREANRRVRDYVSSESGMLFIDVFPKMVDASGAPLADLYAEDRLHLNAKGYALWTSLIEPYLGPPDATH
jgi:lysophospholipase L1-like esterase